LKAGDKIFAYMKGLGYVGYGEVMKEATPIGDFTVDSRGVYLTSKGCDLGRRWAEPDGPQGAGSKARCGRPS
jgi:hypothetical protein